MFSNEDRKILRETWLNTIAILRHLTSNKSLTIEILNQEGYDMGQPVTMTVGAGTSQSVVQEWSGPNGTGTVEPDQGPIEYASDTPAVATVDANGVVTPVAPGTAKITATDSVNTALTDSVEVTVIAAPPPPNQSLTLEIPAN